MVLAYTVSDTDLSIGTGPIVTTDATSPEGATVTYTPPTDSDDTHSTVQSTFTVTVTVKGALAQLQDLLTYVNTLGFRGKLLAAELNNAISNYHHGHTGRVCADLSAVVFAARVARFGHLLTAAHANTVIGDAALIQAAIGCEQH